MMTDLRFPRRFLREDRGAVLVFVGIGLPMFLGMIALVYDVGLMRLHQTRLQITADAAAMAAAQHAADPAAAEVAAQQLVDANYPGTLPAGGVQFVHWNAATRAVEAVDDGAGRPANAVSVTARRDAGTNGVLPFVFARAAGGQGDGFSLAASAVALIGTTPGCAAPSAVIADNGFRKWESKGGASFTGICFHHGNPGKMSGVKDGLRLEGSRIIVPGKQDDPLFQIPENLEDHMDRSVRDEHGVSGTVDLGAFRAFLRGEIDEVKAHSGTPPSSWPLAGITPSFTNVRYSSDDLEIESGESLCSNGVRNSCAANDPVTWHRVKGKVEIEQGADPLRNLVIWATGTIEIGEGVSLTGVTLVTDNKVEIGEGARLLGVTILAASDVTLDEEVRMGAIGGIDHDPYDSYLFSGGNVTIDEEADFASVFVGLANEGSSGANLTIKKDGRFEATSVVTSGWIEMEEGLVMTGAPRTSAYPVPAMPGAGAAGTAAAVALVR